MQYVRLGKSGLKVSRICLGAMTFGSSKWRPWVFDEDASRPFIQRALELGINFFDTADMYSVGVSEEVLGRALKEFSSRDQVIIGTKDFWPFGYGPNDRGLWRKHLFDAIDGSLRRLGVDYVDLYQIHRFDPDTPVEETLDALHDIVKAGKVRYIGASSMYAWQFAKLQHAADLGGWTRFVSMQNQYNLLRRQDEPELMAMCADMDVGCVPCSPQGKGRLARPWGEQSHRSTVDEVVKSFDSPLDEPIVNAVQKIAKARGIGMAQVALAWVLHNPVVSAPIVGATKP